MTTPARKLEFREGEGGTLFGAATPRIFSNKEHSLNCAMRRRNKMMKIQLIKPSKRPSNITEMLFTEKCALSVDSEEVEDIFYDPSKLLERLDLKGILENEPFNSITTAGSVWEYYLLRFVHVKRLSYRQLIKNVDQNESAIDGCRRTALGNPYDIWQRNYKIINNQCLKRKALPFVNILLRRKCPIRQNGTSVFLSKRKIAARAFFSYLIGNTTTYKFFSYLENCNDFQEQLTKLILKHPKNRLFLTSGLMMCLYGGKNVSWLNSKLAKAVHDNLNSFAKHTETGQKTIRYLAMNAGNKHSFKPPFKDIYHPIVGNRERVNINFRIQTWLKLLNDTLYASK
jgi:hypothetical protein